ncbi:MAG: nucleotidyl transferase AbiEii/AbiGii toxin family protein [Rubripirellula sp.]
MALLPANQRSELFEETARVKRVLPAIVEKDFWVCWVLKKLFESDLESDLVFKGGTSLSKVFGLIDRFSEDIDLVLNWQRLGYGKHGKDPWEEQPSANQQNKFNQAFNQQAQRYIETELCPTIQRLLASCPDVTPMVSQTESQVIDIRYPAAFDLAALRPEVKLEIGPLASWVPSAKHTIRPYAADAFANVFDDPDCPVVAITAERTFWEKATILHQQSHRSTPIPPGYSRHYYDMYHLARSDVKATAFSDRALLDDVVQFKKRFYRCPWARYEEAYPGTFRLVPPPEREAELASDYRAMRAMIFKTPPSWKSILNEMQKLEDEINSMKKSSL